MKRFNVALDGPSGAGKSTLADQIAQRYHLTHLDTGAMYRAAALALDAIDAPAKSSPELSRALDSIDLKMQGQNVYLNGVDVTKEIRKPEVSLLASKYSALPEVRRKLVSLQQNIARDKGYILDGRDICSVVLPDAQVKLYLDARADARAKRRQLQLRESGIDQPYEQILAQIEERDKQDRTRKTDPLTVAPDAVVIDSSDITQQQTLELACSLIDQALKGK